VILGVSPFISEYYRKDARSLCAATGGNTGNLAFEFAVHSHLAGTVPILSLDEPARDVRAAGDIIVLPLANQLGAHTDMGDLASRLLDINLPVVGVGLGAQSASGEADIDLQSGTERWLRTLVDLAHSDEPNLGVRGSYTLAQLARYSAAEAAVVIGCPSNFINTEDDIADQIASGFKKPPKLVAVTAGIPHIPFLSTLERELVSIVNSTNGAYIVQHDLEMLQLARGEFDIMPPETLETCRQYILPSEDLHGFKQWCRRYAYAFYDARSWMDFLRRFDFVVGTRVHGAMLALQVGIPAACIAHDSRTMELCQTMGIPVRHHSEIRDLTLSNLHDYFSFDKEYFVHSRRDLLGRYLGIYSAAEIAVNPRLSAMSTS
jgi:hypothetical protein